MAMHFGEKRMKMHKEAYLFFFLNSEMSRLSLKSEKKGVNFKSVLIIFFLFFCYFSI